MTKPRYITERRYLNINDKNDVLTVIIDTKTQTHMINFFDDQTGSTSKSNELARIVVNHLNGESTSCTYLLLDKSHDSIHVIDPTDINILNMFTGLETAEQAGVDYVNEGPLNRTASIALVVSSVQREKVEPVLPSVKVTRHVPSS